MKNKVFEFDEILHEKTRLMILGLLLKEKELSFTDLKEALNLTDGNLTSHLRTLEINGVIEVRKLFIGRKPKTYYRFTKEGKERFIKYLETIENFLKNLINEKEV
ncbi:MAG: transcriptional regulator [Caldisericia bacterium]|jgi:DNA-binding HxlR family transcriptional regulator|nr:transcriptional regulator [Caldisericia bacterium]